MKTVSIVTTMTDPSSRNDPWEEALACYREFADEVIIVGNDWPYEFTWSHIGKTFQEGFKKANGDWVLRMDLDYFLHEKDFKNIKKLFIKYEDYPVISFPQFQFFTEKKYSFRTLIGVAVNKKKFPEVKLNGGGDLCLPTIQNQLLDPFKNPISKFPIYQYDSFFRTKEIISADRARFARAWNREFGNYGDRGGPSENEAYQAWEKMITDKISNHIYNFDLEKHPKYIREKIKNIDKDAFGYNAFGIAYNNPRIRDLLNEAKKIIKIYFSRKKFEFKTL